MEDQWMVSPHHLGCIFLPESSGFLYFPFRLPFFHRNLNFGSAVILFFGIKRSKKLRSKTSPKKHSTSEEGSRARKRQRLGKEAAAAGEEAAAAGEEAAAA